MARASARTSDGALSISIGARSRGERFSTLRRRWRSGDRPRLMPAHTSTLVSSITASSGRPMSRRILRASSAFSARLFATCTSISSGRSGVPAGRYSAATRTSSRLMRPS
ncbi:hypothetical protein D3C85_1384990 [compost metagenome]